jgi:hypothetical protein
MSIQQSIDIDPLPEINELPRKANANTMMRGSSRGFVSPAWFRCKYAYPHYCLLIIEVRKYGYVYIATMVDRSIDRTNGITGDRTNGITTIE